MRSVRAGIICYESVRDWYSKFKKGEYSVQDKPRPGRPSELDDQALLQLVNSNTRVTTRELATALGFDQSTIVRHLDVLGKVPKMGCWVPHKLTERDRDQRVTIASFLLSYSRTNTWLGSLITGDEKWVLYVNVHRRHQWVDQDAEPEPEPKAEIHQKKIMLCVWWDMHGMVHQELLPPNTTINASYYCAQLERVEAELKIKRPGLGKVRFLHDNARPHTAKLTRDKLKELGWEVLPHPPYSPDLAPSDYYLFRHLHYFLKDKIYRNRDQLKQDLDVFFGSQSADFFKKGIEKLVKRWQQVVDSDGEYILD